MRYEWKARLLIGFSCLLLGLTMGALTNGAHSSKVFIYVVDALFTVAIIRFVINTYIRINRFRQARKIEEKTLSERDSD